MIPKKRTLLSLFLGLLVAGGALSYSLARLPGGDRGDAVEAAAPAQEMAGTAMNSATTEAMNDATHGATAVNGPAAAPAPGGEGKAIILKMDSLVANLDEADQLRYLKVTLQIEVTAEAQQRAQERMPRARHEALMYISSLHVSDTQGILGKQRIHRELQRRIADAIGGGLKRIYFEEFVVQ